MTVGDDFLNLPKWCSMTEAARFLEVDRKTVRRYVDAGYLQAWTPEIGWRRISRDSIGRLCGIIPKPSGFADPDE